MLTIKIKLNVTNYKSSDHSASPNIAKLQKKSL